MWASLDLMERMRAAALAMNETEEMQQKVMASGKGICLFCDSEIYRNDSVPGSGWIWESESLVGFCEKGTGKKHAPGAQKSGVFPTANGYCP